VRGGSQQTHEQGIVVVILGKKTFRILIGVDVYFGQCGVNPGVLAALADFALEPAARN
jgi:hypothetical protein